MDYNSAFVCLMGMGTVFFGLICLIVLTKLMSLLCGRKSPVPAEALATQATAPERIPPELVAGVAAAIAEDLGTDITGIRIRSIRKI